MTVSEKLRLVEGLHSHAEMFGFDWDDDSDWTWHDVACEIADEVDAENDSLREQGVRAMDKIMELGTENSKLKELVRELYGYFELDADPLDDVYESMRNRMCELGIEVNE